MSNILAGIDRRQMEVINERVESRRNNHSYYKNLFNTIDGITFLDELNTDFYSNFWLTTILIDENKTNGISAEKLRLELEKENIEARPLWKPMHLQPIFEKYPKYLNEVSEKLFKTGLCLPSGSNMTDEDRDRISNVINKLFSK